MRKHDGEHVGRECPSRDKEFRCKSPRSGTALLLTKYSSSSATFSRFRAMSSRRVRPGQVPPAVHQHILPQDFGSRIKVLVDSMTESHQTKSVVLVFRLLNPFLVVAAVVLNHLQHFQHGLIGAPMERSPEGTDACRDGCEYVGSTASHHTDRRGTAVLFMVGMKNQQCVQSLRHRRD